MFCDEVIDLVTLSRIGIQQTDSLMAKHTIFFFFEVSSTWWDQRLICLINATFDINNKLLCGIIILHSIHILLIYLAVGLICSIGMFNNVFLQLGIRLFNLWYRIDDVYHRENHWYHITPDTRLLSCKRFYELLNYTIKNSLAKRFWELFVKFQS